MKKVLIYPNEILNVKSKKIAKIDPKIKYIVKNMFNIMYEKEGIGLAAIQIGINLRVMTIDINSSKNKFIALINPEIINFHGLESGYEACLSFPGVYLKITRFSYIKVEYFNEFGFKCYVEAKRILSRCIQHELDHLNGLTIFDHISVLKKKRMLNKICV